MGRRRCSRVLLLALFAVVVLGEEGDRRVEGTEIAGEAEESVGDSEGRPSEAKSREAEVGEKGGKEEEGGEEGGEEEEGEEEEEEEEEPRTTTGIAMSGTLLGAVSFNLILFYLTNHPDEDMRRYSYEIINATVSIFVAVLMFQTFNDVVSQNFFHPAVSKEYEAVIDFIHMLVWFTILQLALAYISGAIGSPPKSMEVMKVNMKSVAQLLAHLTGFASINAWGSLQQCDYFKSSWYMSFAVLPISMCGQFLLQRITHNIRHHVNMMDDGEEDEYEKAWNEETAEAENDVMGLTVSFNLTQACRFAITGVLPNQEGEVPRKVIDVMPLSFLWKMYGCGLFFILLMTVVFWLMPSKEEEGSESGSDHSGPSRHGSRSSSKQGSETPAKQAHGEAHEGEPKAIADNTQKVEKAAHGKKDGGHEGDHSSHGSGHGRGHGCGDGGKEGGHHGHGGAHGGGYSGHQHFAKQDSRHGHHDLEANAHAEHHQKATEAEIEAEEEREEGSLLERCQEVGIITFSMGFAWCVFFGTRMALAHVGALADNMILAVTLTMTISFGSFSVIRALDHLADWDATGEKVDLAIVQVIKAIGILVGFAWEQTFDEAVANLASATTNPHLSKAILAFFCVAILLPAWKMYLLPMALQEGWKFGFVIHEEDVGSERFEKVVNHLHKKHKKLLKNQDTPPVHAESARSVDGRGAAWKLQYLRFKMSDGKAFRRTTTAPAEAHFDHDHDMSTAEREELSELRKEVAELQEKLLKAENQAQVVSPRYGLRPLSPSSFAPASRAAPTISTPVTPDGQRTTPSRYQLQRAEGGYTPRALDHIHQQIDTLESLTQSLVCVFEKSRRRNGGLEEPLLLQRPEQPGLS